MTLQPERQVEILLVEDDPGDVLMTREAFQDYKLRNQLHVVSDGAEAIKSDPELASIPVVVLTTSEAEDDVLRSYSLHANAYVTKPVDFERVIHVVSATHDFFVSVVRLPRR